MKTTILGSLIGAFILIVCVIAAAQAEIKVGIAGPLSGSALNAWRTAGNRRSKGVRPSE